MPDLATVHPPPPQPPPPAPQPPPSPFERLLHLQITRPIAVLALVGLITAGSVALAFQLKLLTGFENLLPESRPSVGELKRVEARTTSLSTIFVVLEGQDPAGLRKAADALVPALAALGPPWVGQVENGVQEAVRFLEPRAGLFADLKKLEALRDDVEARFQYEVAKESGSLLDEDEPPPPLDAATIEKKLGADALQKDRFPDGRYQSADGKTVVLTIRCGIVGTDIVRGQEALARVSAAVASVDPRKFDPAAKWGLTGDLAIGISEYKLISADLTDIGVAGVLLVLGAVLLFYLRLRTTIAMSLAIGIGVAWTFGLTQLLLGHLNIATGFLFSIIAGNGINFSIIFMDRYLEERRRAVPVAESILIAAKATWQPTLTAAAAAGAAYGALVITEFKGFKEFGVIGGLGMLLCWIATFLALPSILVVTERLAPLDKLPRNRVLRRLVEITAHGIPFGRPFAAVVARAPRLIATVGTLLAVLGTVATVRWVRADPMEYDTNQIQSDRSTVAEVHRLIHVAKEITGYIGLDGMAIVTDRLDQVAPLKAALLARRDAAPADAKPFLDVHTLFDFVPPDQEAKIEVLQQLKRRVLRSRELGALDDRAWARVEKYLPPDDLAPFGIADLPEAVARQFSEKDGSRGRVVYISPLSGELTSDAHYLLRWADSFRRTELPDGSVVLGSGRAVIYADMWDAVLSDVPRAVLVSFAATLLIVALAFRRRAPIAQAILTMLAGVAWMVGGIALAGTKLNFMNFIALPLTFGIGIDYAVNIIQRDRESRDSLAVLRSTGGAVVLCSLTTLLGYLALVRSVNFGVRSMGLAAVVGELACLLSSVLVLPAALAWWRKRRASGAAPSAPA